MTKKPSSVTVNHIHAVYTVRIGHKSQKIPASRRAAPHVAAILRKRGVRVIEVLPVVIDPATAARERDIQRLLSGEVLAEAG